MIEINLLPQEYRVQDRTPLGLLLTVVVGLCAVGAISIYWIDRKKELAAVENKNARLTEMRDTTAKERQAVEKLKKEIETAKKRQETIIEISQSKIVWSQKLVQFGKIMAEFPDFWIDRLQLSKADKSKLTLTFYALGSDLRKVAAFRERIESDTNFWYHFERFEAPRTSTSSSGPLRKYGYEGPTMNFDVVIPVK